MQLSEYCSEQLSSALQLLYEPHSFSDSLDLEFSFRRQFRSRNILRTIYLVDKQNLTSFTSRRISFLECVFRKIVVFSGVSDSLLILLVSNSDSDAELASEICRQQIDVRTLSFFWISHPNTFFWQFIQTHFYEA